MVSQIATAPTDFSTIELHERPRGTHAPRSREPSSRHSHSLGRDLGQRLRSLALETRAADIKAIALTRDAFCLMAFPPVRRVGGAPF